MKTVFFSIATCWSLAAAEWTDYFSFERVVDPVGIDSQVGAMATLEDGRIAVAFHRGEVMFYDSQKKSWDLFATGLHEPLGMVVEDEGSLLIMQRPELTRLKDSDGDGMADEYETVFDGFGMSGNYHEFSYGPAKDEAGNLFIVLGVASNGAPIRKEVRGEFLELGELDRPGITEGREWGKNRNKAGRMYSRVPYRGWVLKLSPDGSEMEPWASGFRSPNGIGFDSSGRLLITDNQGDWRPTSPLYEVEKNGFYGHPASLPWRANWDGRDPLKVAVSELAELQKPAAGYFPQGELANSPTQPLAIPEDVFPEGMGGQTVIGEMNQPLLVRVLDDEVDGVFQTALVPLFDKSPLGLGNNRMTFGDDGSLYVGKTALSWAGSRGVVRIKWNGKPFLFLEKMNAVKDGFVLSFSQAIDQETVKTLDIERHTYSYHADYGSSKVDKKGVKVRKAEMSADGKSLSLDLGGLREGYLHKVDLSGLRSAKGEEVLGATAWYQVVKAPK